MRKGLEILGQHSGLMSWPEGELCFKTPIYEILVSPKIELNIIIRSTTCDRALLAKSYRGSFGTSGMSCFLSEEIEYVNLFKRLKTCYPISRLNIGNFLISTKGALRGIKIPLNSNSLKTASVSVAVFSPTVLTALHIIVRLCMDSSTVKE